MNIGTLTNFTIDFAKLKIYRRFNRPLEPRVLAYNVTSQCNCNCLMCKIGSKFPMQSSEELNAYDIKRMFDDKILHNFHLVRFTGGEPFIKDDFIEIAKIIIEKSNAKIIYITTNGYFTGRIIELVKIINKLKRRMLHIQVSLDGVESAHDKIRNLEGLFCRVYNTLAELKTLQKEERFSVGVSQVILKENADQIKPVNRIANEFGFKHYLNFALWPTESCPTDSYKDNLSHGVISNFSKDEFSLVRKMIIDIKKEQRKQSMKTVNGLRSLADRWYEDKCRQQIPVPKFMCLALFIYCRLTSDGFLIPCIVNSESKVGNVKEDSFSNIWNSEKAYVIREKIKNCSGCWVWCDIMPSFYYSGLFIYEYLRQKLKYSKDN